jgi:hypothetical protein
MNSKWRRFVRRLGKYVIIIGMLTLINLMTLPNDFSFYKLWVIWPALGWGVSLAFDFFNTLMGDDTEVDEDEAQNEVIWGQTTVEEPSVATPSVTRQRLMSDHLRTYLEKAQAYQKQIDELTSHRPDIDTNARLKGLTDNVSEWTEAIASLIGRVDNFQRNIIIHQDLEQVPQSITSLKARLSEENDPGLRLELEQSLANRQKQLAALQHLQTTMQRAEIKIERTLSSLGTIYSQILTGQSTDQVADYSHLSVEAEEEVRVLQDYLEALEEVKMNNQ